MAFVVIATWTARPEEAEHVADLIRRMIPANRAEPKNLSFEAHRRLDDPAVFVLVERYVDASGYEDHRATEQFQTLVIGEVIRSEIGFDGLLMSDDLGMQALKGSFAERATGVLAAGCDIALHCSGDFAEMAEIAAVAPGISPAARERLARAMAWPKAGAQLDLAGLSAKRDALLALA